MSLLFFSFSSFYLVLFIYSSFSQHPHLTHTLTKPSNPLPHLSTATSVTKTIKTVNLASWFLSIPRCPFKKKLMCALCISKNFYVLTCIFTLSVNSTITTIVFNYLGALSITIESARVVIALLLGRVNFVIPYNLLQLLF